MSPTQSAPEYIAARTALLHTLEALQADLDALVLVGAQAVYLRTGSGGLPIAPYTTDADVSIEPAALRQDATPLDEVLQAAGFRLLGQNPGQWQCTVEIEGTAVEIPVDLMVPSLLLPESKGRSARISGQDSRLARLTRGLEAAIVDNDTLPISALHGGDARTFLVAVAGPVALLLAKGVKITDRAAQRGNRPQPKDALDVFRLLQSTRPEDLQSRLGRALTDPTLGATIHEHADILLTCFADRGPGMDLLRPQLTDMGLDPVNVRSIVRRGTDAIAAALN